MRRFLPAAMVALAVPAFASGEGGHEGGGGASLISPDFGMIFWTVVTFVILLVVLRAVAWKPLLGAVEARERNIQSNIDDARRQRDEAESLLQEHRKLMDDARRQTAEIVGRGQRDAERLVEDAKQKAREESEKLLTQTRGQIEQETRAALAEVRGTVADLAIAAAGKLLEKNVDDESDRTLVDQYVRDLETRRDERPS